MGIFGKISKTLCNSSPNSFASPSGLFDMLLSVLSSINFDGANACFGRLIFFAFSTNQLGLVFCLIFGFDIFPLVSKLSQFKSLSSKPSPIL